MTTLNENKTMTTETGNKQGRVNTTLFINNIIKRSQDDLLVWLPDVLRKMAMSKVYACGDYVFGLGDIPVLLVCHLDTVHKQVPQTVLCQHGMMWSPEGVGGDDRCGVYAILEIIKRLPIGKRPYVLFTTDEEIGGVGIGKFVREFPTNDYGIKFSIEYDRKGYNDICFYSTYDDEFIAYVTDKTGYKEAYGSYTDIVDLMDAWDLPGVNMSVGYYNAHTNAEYIVLKHLQRAIDISVEWLENEDFELLPDYCAMSYNRPVSRFNDYGTYSYTSYDRGLPSYNSWYQAEYCYLCSTTLTIAETELYNGLCRDCHTDYYGVEQCEWCGDEISTTEHEIFNRKCEACYEASKEVEMQEEK